MNPKKFLKDEKGVIATEYVIFVAAIGMLLTVGVGLLFNSMGGLFSSWATYFGAGG